MIRKSILAALAAASCWLSFLSVAGAANPVVRLETNKGDIHLELDAVRAPLTTANFLYYVSTGFYDATVFHRVIQDFVIQGGGYGTSFYSNPLTSGKTPLSPIPNEAANGLGNDAYTIAMARGGSPHSATSQFFINAANNSFLNHVDETTTGWGYAVFGKVIGGEDIVDAIESMATTDTGYPPFEDVPTTPVIVSKAVIEGAEEPAALEKILYFPHVAANSEWGTEIAVINTGDATVTGLLQAFADNGSPLSGVVWISAPAKGRQEITVAEAFPNASGIGYMVFRSSSSSVTGYTKFHRPGQYRVALPAVADIPSGDLHLSHVASSSEWWTGVSLLNTKAESVTVTLEFNTGESVSRTLGPAEHKAFTIRELFNGTARPEIASAMIRNGAGVVGLELFGATAESGKSYLGGIPLSDTLASDLYFAHLHADTEWWTGVVVYNPGDRAVQLRIKPYSASGTALSSQKTTVAAKSRFVSDAWALNLPAATAWFQVEATDADGGDDAYVSGFELFGKMDGSDMAGYSVVDLNHYKGLLAKNETDGWTGIALVNTDYSRANVTLSALSDDGEEVAKAELVLESRQKVARLAGDFFDDDISGARYFRFSSDRKIAAFQLNGEGQMLDGLPAASLDD